MKSLTFSHRVFILSKYELILRHYLVSRGDSSSLFTGETSEFSLLSRRNKEDNKKICISHRSPLKFSAALVLLHADKA